MARNLILQFTPCSNYYVTKNIWFHEEVVKRGIKLLKIDTVEHIGRLFTKELLTNMFEYMHKNIMGWYISKIYRINPQEGMLRLIF